MVFIRALLCCEKRREVSCLLRIAASQHTQHLRGDPGEGPIGGRDWGGLAEIEKG
jgi:hypothetical protein